jgi:hypothetical protein
LLLLSFFFLRFIAFIAYQAFLWHVLLRIFCFVYVFVCVRVCVRVHVLKKKKKV